MRRTFVWLTVLGLALVVFGSSAVLKSKAEGAATIVTQTPGSRCTRFMFPPKEKKTSRKKKPDDLGFAVPGTRCTRFYAGRRKGTILPNTPPKVGLAMSTAYIAANADPQVNLKAIACDADGDNVLYTYSATGGRITGDGPTTIWNLSGVTRPGTFTVTVEVDDGCGCISFDSSTVTVE